MNPLRFLFAVHCHQPVGNFDHVFDKAFNDCYEPFLNEVAKHPAFKFALHFSGPLWEHMEKRRKECGALIKELAGRGQVELLGGGFYEPILCIIPEEDRIGQVRMMNRYIEENFGVTPKGAWLTERVWEPNLPKSLSRAGIEYTLLDEEHFHYAGVKDIHTSYATEDEGYPLRVFPIDKKLRYLIPFRPLDEIEAYFNDIREMGGIAVLGDDGEKFGLWPGTKSWVYDEGWLANFLRFIEEKEVRTMTFSEYAAAEPPGGKVYLPPASYEEMMEWVLEPTDLKTFKKLKEESPAEARRFLRGGFFRDFFLKYPESNHLHKRMLLTSKKVRASGSESAATELYKAQGNDPFWHGVFGGLYLPHLREAAYRHLIEAEKRMPEETGWRMEDYDQDGRTEALHFGDRFNLIVKPSFGGGIVEIDHKPLSRNLSDVLSRRPEAYHAAPEEGIGDGKSIHELRKELPEGAEDLLRYDWHPRYSSLDHFLHPATRPEDFRRIDFGEQGDFINREYSYFIEGPSLRLERDGSVWADGKKRSIIVRKRIIPGPGVITVEYEVENREGKPVSLVFAPEWNLYAFEGDLIVSGREAKLLEGKLAFQAPGADELWTFPLRTLSQSEEGYDIIHQGFCLLPVWRLHLSGKGRSQMAIVLAEKNVQ
jgi:alpha-amylase/alpha-mannosidase (GH57 family)